MTKYKASMETLEGVVRLTGEIDFLDPADAPIGPAGGTLTGALTIDTSAGAGATVPLDVKASLNAQGENVFTVENVDLGGGPMLEIDAGGNFIVSNGFGNVRLITSSIAFGVNLPLEANALITAALGVATKAITAGALPTVAPVSGAAFQCSATRDVHLVVPCTMNPTAGAAATVKVELSPDNVTFSTLLTITEPAGVALDGTILPASIHVPAGWRVKLTATNAVLGTGTYY